MDSRMNQFVRISRKNSRYFEYEDGTPFVPVGMNLCFERFSGDDAEILAIYRRWFRRFSENGGNFARIWLGVPFLNLEPEKPGVFSERKHSFTLPLPLTDTGEPLSLALLVSMFTPSSVSTAFEPEEAWTEIVFCVASADFWVITGAWSTAGLPFCTTVCPEAVLSMPMLPRERS